VKEKERVNDSDNNNNNNNISIGVVFFVAVVVNGVGWLQQQQTCGGRMMYGGWEARERVAMVAALA